MKIEAFKTWLLQQGAEVLAPTNQYEVLRVRARGRVFIAYKDKNGRTTWPDFLDECCQAFENGGSVSMGLTAVPRTAAAKYRLALIERDGMDCFYCLKPMPNDDITIEHLVSLHKGGPNHLDNMALAHGACNRSAGNKPLRDKIRMHVAAWLVKDQLDRAGIK